MLREGLYMNPRGDTIIEVQRGLRLTTPMKLEVVHLKWIGHNIGTDSYFEDKYWMSPVNVKEVAKEWEFLDDLE